MPCFCYFMDQWVSGVSGLSNSPEFICVIWELIHIWSTLPTRGADCSSVTDSGHGMHMGGYPVKRALSYGKPFGFLFSISRYRELFPDIGNWNSRYREINFRYREMIDFPIQCIGKWFSDIGNWLSNIGKCVWFPDIGKSIPDIRKSPPDRSRSLRHPATPPYYTAPYQQRPPAIPAPSACGDRHYDFSKSISTTNNNHTTNDFAKKYRNLWCWVNVLTDIDKNWTLI